VLPTPVGQPSTLATGWVWALATPPSENQQLSVELAEFLTDSSFLFQWNQSLGYLPVRPSSLAVEPESTHGAVIERVVNSAILFPSRDILMSVGPALQEATVDVLKQQADPLTAAQLAATSLAKP
jgi:ABC-type glycerol-3-phosphate transport system substrate-binding protein